MNQFNSNLVGAGAGRVHNVVIGRRADTTTRAAQPRVVHVLSAEEAAARAERSKELFALGAVIVSTIGLGAFLVIQLANSLQMPILF